MILINKVLTVFFFLGLLGCNNHKQRSCNPYFSFDKVDHYYSNIAESTFWDIDKKEKKTAKEKRQVELLIGKTPGKLSDTIFLGNMETLGFEKREIPVTKFKQLNEIFCEKTHNEIFSMTCEPVYRDILVFKKENKIMGTAKICFGCTDNIIAGTNSNTMEFGQSGDYGKLFKLLHKR